VDFDTTQFQADRLLTGQPNGQRTFAVAQWSRPWVSPAGFITPKLQLHATNYQFNGPLANGATSASRVVPTFSLDSGVVFERDASYFGRAFRQTLEPRAFYVHTPVSQPGPVAELRLRRRTTSTLRASTPRTRSSATTASPTATC
jgi:LPS-assembly protein